MDTNKLVEDALSEASKLINNNKQVLAEIKKKFDQTDQLIFDETCYKRDHLDRCEVTNCCYFRDGTCKYPEAHRRLKLILKEYSF